MRQKEKIPSWIKLDNAATIYPSTLSKKYASMFRMSVSLTEKVDKDTLEKALENILKRFPTFRYKLKQGLFWCYFKYNNAIPDVQEDYNNPLLRINFKDNKSFMFRIRYFENKISIEYFHALTDGTGGITFLLTLAGEYLKIKHNIKITYDDKVLNPRDTPTKDECSDSFKKYTRKLGGLEYETPAFHQKGTNEPDYILNIITGIISVEELKKKCKEYSCTITQFLSAVMILSYQDIQEKTVKKVTRRKPIKLCIPINLRSIYKTNTLRNFTSYINVGIEPKYGHYTFEETLKIIKNQMELGFSEKRLNAKITANVKLSRNYFIRLIPMFIKKHILSTAEFLMGDRYCCVAFSNLGLIKVPEEMKPYIEGMRFLLGRSRTNKTTCACISYEDKLYISFSRIIKEAELERLFFTKLVEMGIPVTVESNSRR